MLANEDSRKEIAAIQECADQLSMKIQVSPPVLLFALFAIVDVALITHALLELFSALCTCYWSRVFHTKTPKIALELGIWKATTIELN